MSPRFVEQAHHDRIERERRTPKRLREGFFVVLVLDRDRYTCRYCGRNADEVWEESGHRWTI